MCSNNTLLFFLLLRDHKVSKATFAIEIKLCRLAPSYPFLSSSWVVPSTITPLHRMENELKIPPACKSRGGVSQKITQLECVLETVPQMPACTVHPARWRPKSMVKVKANGCVETVVRPRAYKTWELCPWRTWQLLTALSHGIALSFHSQSWYLNYFGF